MDNILLNEISKLEENGVILYKFGVCTTGIDTKTAKAMQNHADMIWSCALKMIRNHIVENAIAQIGVSLIINMYMYKSLLIGMMPVCVKR